MMSDYADLPNMEPREIVEFIRDDMRKHFPYAAFAYNWHFYFLLNQLGANELSPHEILMRVIAEDVEFKLALAMATQESKDKEHGMDN